MDWNQLLTDFVELCKNVAWRLLLALLVLIVGKIISAIVIRLLKKKALTKKLDPTVHGFVLSFTKVAMGVIIAIIIVAVLGIPTASVITVLGSVGVAISLALQGTLGNMASGLMLLIFRPFKDGDFIEVSGQSGTVTEIAIFYTSIVTVDNRQVVIPNSTLTSSLLINYSAFKLRRLDVDFNVAYGSDVEKVKKTVMTVLERHKDIMSDPAPFIRMTDMKSNTLCVTLRAWCEKDNYWDLKFNLLEEIYEEFKAAGIEIPFQQVDVHVKNK